MSSQFTFDLPEPVIRQHVAPAGFIPHDAWPELYGVVALDFETDDPGLGARRGSSWAVPGEGFVCGFSIAWGGGSCYCSLRHAGGNTEDEAKAWRWLAAQAAKPDVTFCYANAIYDLGWLTARHGIEPHNPPIDVQGMAALLDAERSSYSLDALARDFLGRPKAIAGLNERAREIGIPNAIQHMKRLPAWVVGPYGISDAVDTLDLYKVFAPKIEAEDLGRVLLLERECLLVARDLKMRGVRVDLTRAATTKQGFIVLRDAAIGRIKDATGINVSPWDNVAIARALHVENPALVLEKTSTGKESIRAAVIESLKTPVAINVEMMRKLDKCITTFFEGYIEAFATKSGRLHADFHPLRRTRDEAEGGGNAGAGPGRWSSSGPNLQNIPRRDKVIGPAIRQCFLPEEGEQWGKLDYASQEPRLATHYANLARGVEDGRRWRLGRGGEATRPLPGAADMVAKYNANPTLSLHRETAKLMGLENYDAAKIINLAIMYGAQGKMTCNQLGLPTKWIETRSGKVIEVAGDEGQALLDKHHASLPWVRGLAEIAKDAAEWRGYVKTILGRRIRFTKRDMNDKLMFTYKALNNIVQGSAADQMKTAQVGFRRAGIPILVVVHDDANLSLPRGAGGQRILAQASDIMRDAIQLSVPSLAESKVGETWGDVG